MVKRLLPILLVGVAIATVVLAQSALSAPRMQVESPFVSSHESRDDAFTTYPGSTSSSIPESDAVAGGSVLESNRLGATSQSLDEQVDIIPNPQNGTDGPVVTQARSLVETFRQAGSDRLGMWLHIVARNNSTATDAGTMPETGQLVRVGPFNEAWYQLDARGYVQAYISFMRAADGSPVQISTFSEGVVRNLTLDIKFDQQPYPFDQFLTSLIASGWEAETLLQVVEGMDSGQALTFFTTYTEYDEPTYFEDLQLSVIALERREGYDPTTGIRMQAESIAFTAFGERIVYSSNETLLAEWVMQPPEEVLEFLSQEVASE